MKQFRLPLSGDVTQSINPWTWVWDGNQFGNITVNLGLSRDPQMERDILQQVGSYGRQIGQITDAMKVLVARLDRSSLTPQEQRAIELFEIQAGMVELVKKSAALEKKAA